MDQESGFGGYKIFDGGDVEEHDDFHTVKMSSLGFTIFPVAMLKNMPIFIRYKYKDEIAHACPIFYWADFDENHHFIHRKMAKHSKFAMGAILMKIVILSCRFGGILFRLENAPGCAPIS